VDVIEGRKDAEEMNAIQLFPNPATDVVNLVGSPGKAIEWALFAIDGRMISSGSSIGAAQIQVSGLSPGLYLVKENQTGSVGKVWVE
jgi:Secretion system C-terminal sorting domain